MSEICRCSHPKEFHQSFLKEVPCDYDGKCVGGCQKFEPVGSDRHPKWQRVEPGTVIPAGQPYRVEFADKNLVAAREHRGDIQPFFADPRTVRPGGDPNAVYFIDSSWKPPLVLPTEPTWGIAVINDAEDEGPIDWIVDRWVHENPKYDPQLRMSGHHTASLYGTSEVLDFIPLTDEQVTRLIEATR